MGVHLLLFFNGLVRLAWISSDDYDAGGNDDDAAGEVGGFQFLLLSAGELVQAKERPCQNQKLTLAECHYSTIMKDDFNQDHNQKEPAHCSVSS